MYYHVVKFANGGTSRVSILMLLLACSVRSVVMPRQDAASDATEAEKGLIMDPRFTWPAGLTENVALRAVRAGAAWLDTELAWQCIKCGQCCNPAKKGAPYNLKTLLQHRKGCFLDPGKVCSMISRNAIQFMIYPTRVSISSGESKELKLVVVFIVLESRQVFDLHCFKTKDRMQHTHVGAHP